MVSLDPGALKAALKTHTMLLASVHSEPMKVLIAMVLSRMLAGVRCRCLKEYSPDAAPSVRAHQLIS